MTFTGPVIRFFLLFYFVCNSIMDSKTKTRYLVSVDGQPHTPLRPGFVSGKRPAPTITTLRSVKWFEPHRCAIAVFKITTKMYVYIHKFLDRYIETSFPYKHSLLSVTVDVTDGRGQKFFFPLLRPPPTRTHGESRGARVNFVLF